MIFKDRLLIRCREEKRTKTKTTVAKKEKKKGGINKKKKELRGSIRIRRAAVFSQIRFAKVNQSHIEAFSPLLLPPTHHQSLNAHTSPSHTPHVHDAHVHPLDSHHPRHETNHHHHHQTQATHPYQTIPKTAPPALQSARPYA